MYIALNPKQKHRFVTKGINLHLKSPVAYVPETLEPEFRAKIEEAIKAQDVFVIPDNEAMNLMVPGIGSNSGIKENEEKKSGFVTKTYKGFDDDPDAVVRVFIIPEDIEETSEENKIILTDGD